MAKSTRIALAAALILPGMGASVHAQGCEPGWSDRFYTDGMDDLVCALVTWDRGNDVEVYAGGAFVTAGPSQARHVARLVGGEWRALGSGTNDLVRALAVYDTGDGNSAALYAGGHFTEAGGVAASYIAKWDGERWSALRGGVDGSVRALTVWDDGHGPALYATGAFTRADGVVVNGIAKWDGESWSALASGIPATSPTGLALCGFDDGSGSSLYVGGYFFGVANNIARWDGAQWHALGTGCNDAVRALAAGVEFGSPVLYAGGSFGLAGRVAAGRVARWAGSQWGPLGGGLHSGGYTSYVSSLTIADDGSGPSLYAGGYFQFTGNWLPRRNIARWDGSVWFDVGGGANSAVLAMTPWSGTDESGLIAAGWFTRAGNLGVSHVARWSGAGWGRLATSNGVAGTISTLHGVPSGPLRGLYVGGAITNGGEVAVSNIARWSENSWSALGDGVSGGNITPVTAIQAFDDGNGEKLYVGGALTSAGGVPATGLAAWDGSTWTVPPGAFVAPPGSGGPHVYALVPFDSGNGAMLAVAGSFITVGGTGVNHVALWDGQVWTSLGSGLQAPTSLLAVHDDGSGPTLYADGSDGFVRWDGTTWRPVGAISSSGGLYTIRSAMFEGSRSLFVAGTPIYEGAEPYNVARWNGAAWAAVGGGMCFRYLKSVSCGSVFALAVWNDPLGDRLFAGGSFDHAEGLPARCLASWDGHAWSEVGGGVGSYVNALEVFDDGTGPSLWVGGTFNTAGGHSAGHIAQWRLCAPCSADWDGSGALDTSDVLAFLADLFAGAPRADFNQSGTTDSQDFFDFLAAFFQGCP